MKLENELIAIALKDIKASRLLYENGLYAQSYFCFQQGSEKASKALGLHIGVINKDELKENIRHNQLKIYRKAIVAEAETVKSTMTMLELNPHLTSHKLFKDLPIEMYSERLEEGIRFHDSAKNLDLLNYSINDLNYFLDCIEEFYFFKINRSKKDDKLLLEKLNLTKDFFNQFASEDQKKELSDFLRKGNEEVVLKITYSVLRDAIKSLFISYTFYFCACLTIRHSNISRYSDDSINPLIFYTKKNQSVKFQPIFMEYLEIALRRFKKIIN